jgi:hypothetical protein
MRNSAAIPFSSYVAATSLTNQVLLVPMQIGFWLHSQTKLCLRRGEPVVAQARTEVLYVGI